MRSHLSYSAFVDLILPDGRVERFDGVADWKFFDADGTLAGSVAAFVQNVAHHPDSRKTFLDHAPSGQGDFYVELVPPAPWFADHPTLGRCQTHRIGLSVTTQRERASLKTASAIEGDKVLTLASATLNSGTLEVVFEESQDCPAEISSKGAPRVDGGA